MDSTVAFVGYFGYYPKASVKRTMAYLQWLKTPAGKSFLNRCKMDVEKAKEKDHGKVESLGLDIESKKED